jgi:alkylation response protein AidB-like acyl-CoA dehydrogenase
MDFEFTDEQKMLRETFRKFCEKEVTPEYVRWMDENCDWLPKDMIKKIAALGYLSILVPEEYGGLGLGYVDLSIAMEELCTAGVGVGFGAGISIAFGTTPLVALGTNEQKEKYLPGIMEGEELWAMALTEPGGGTDILGAIRTTAVKDGDEYILNGNKMFISGAHVADYIIVIAITDKEAKRKNGLSILIVDAKTPGITINLIKKVSIKSCGTTEISFEDVRVPAKNILGTENKGLYELMYTLNPERISTAMFSLGIAKAAFNYALQYSKEREAFGRPIGAFQSLQHYLADIAIEIENARNLIYKCAWLHDSGKRFDVEATMAKIVACRASELAARHGMEILGGYGVTMEYDMQRHFRDYKQMMFSPISDEMAKNYIAQSFGLPRSY